MKKAKQSNKYLVLSTIAILVILGIGITVHYLSSHKVPTTESEYTKGQSSTNNSKDNNGNQKVISGSTSTLIQPFGDFVSNHHISLSADPSMQTLTSVCNTTPGASCKVTFTLGSLVKTLPSKTADQGGSVYWADWTPNSIGLTIGSWAIKAIATLNGETKTSVDAQNLEITK